MDTESSLHFSTETLLYIERDSLSLAGDYAGAVVFIANNAEIYGLKSINNAHFIIQQNRKIGDESNAHEKPAKKQPVHTLKSSSPIDPADEKVYLSENSVHSKSSEHFTASTHFSNAAVIPLSNINLKTAMPVPLYFNISRGFLLESSLEKECFFFLIHRLSFDNYKVRPPPCNIT
ncbi:hypothetical protein B0A69_02145 [Chryseobacterium shigense]|uniref:Uncharacterized protein n=1 Tax=Chryseobacterium shigense TaxID=297244 RepID=A0A1N7I9C8_9FLAO|nr:hypothetical protein [Chryseobacterium shigense]PQA96889.1 hypothetical protein B0A69_02145 [Chryseobacterium shigense]SIS33671.1 hypothetical protein SAMN05421639_102704 [Chryseobacterium shigense]